MGICLLKRQTAYDVRSSDCSSDVCSSDLLRVVPELFKAAREALDWDVHLLHDIHHRLTPIEAGRLGRDLEPYRPFWLEDATPAENQEAFRLIRQHTTAPLAVGEIFNSIWDAKDRSEEHTSELQSLMRNSYAVFCLKKKKITK